jgi:hypothetical protein
LHCAVDFGLFQKLRTPVLSKLDSDGLSDHKQQAQVLLING